MTRPSPQKTDYDGSRLESLGRLGLNCTECSLRQLTRVISRHFDRYLRPLGLRSTQYAFLAHIEDVGAAQLNQIAKSMRLEPSTVSRALEVMGKAGWLIVLPGKNRRSLTVELTVQGKALRRSAQVNWTNAQEALDLALGQGTLQRLNTLLDQSLALLDADEAS